MASSEEMVQKFEDVSRKSSRLVAIVDLIMCFLGLCLLLGQVFMRVVYTVLVLDPENIRPDVHREVVTAFLWRIWAPMGIAALVLGYGGFAAINLLVATTKGANPELALEKARRWKLVNIIFFLLICVSWVVADQSVATSTLYVIYRGMVLIAVCDFMEDLEGQAKLAAIPNPIIVIVKNQLAV